MKKLILITSLFIIAFTSKAAIHVHIRQYTPAQTYRHEQMRDMAKEKRNGFFLDQIIYHTKGSAVIYVEYIYVDRY